MAPVLDKVAPKLEHQMKIAKIDCTVEKALCKEHNVRGYPTLMFHRSGTDGLQSYQGGRSERDIVQFAERMSRHPTQPVSSIQDVQQIALRTISGDQLCFVAYDSKAMGSTVDDVIASSEILAEYKAVARKMQVEGNFALLMPGISESTISEFGVDGNIQSFIAKVEPGVPPVVFYPHQDDNNITNFIQESNHALVTELSGRNFSQLAESGKMIVIGVVGEDSGKAAVILKDMKAVAMNADNDMNSKFIFGWIDGQKFSRFLSQFGMTGDSSEIFVFDPTKRQYYNDEGLISANDLIKRIMSGEIEGKEQKKPEKASAPKAMWAALKSVYKQYKPWSYAIFVPVVLLFVQVLLGIKEGLAMRAKDSNRVKESSSRLKQD